MNEQLVVKNFGPIKDATVDFKRVTVFIGPTGGGKSTLAKLAAIFRSEDFYDESAAFAARRAFKEFVIDNFFSINTSLTFLSNAVSIEYADKKSQIKLSEEKTRQAQDFFAEIDRLLEELKKTPGGEGFKEKRESIMSRLDNDKFSNYAVPVKIKYVPAERVFVPAVEYSWAGLMSEGIGLPKALLEFANIFSLSRKDVRELDIQFLNVKYLHLNGRDFIKIPEREEPLMLLETASGIQSVTPLLVLLEHLSRNTEQAQSFIIEEPELNLYPTAQRDLVYTLLEKCTQGENDLTITTHSPYVLSALNLALYANKVATLFPHQHKKVAKLIPAKYWLKAENFSAYFVAKGGVKTIFDTKTGLLNESQLDEVSGEFADVFDHLTDLRVPEKKVVAKTKSAKK